MELEKPFEEYLRREAEIFFGTKPVPKKKFKCFLWLPKIYGDEPHLYLQLDCKEDYDALIHLTLKQSRFINIRIDIPYNKQYIIKKFFVQKGEKHFYQIIGMKRLSNILSLNTL